MRSRSIPLFESIRARRRETALVVIGIIALLSAVFATFDLLNALKDGEAVYSVSVSGLSIEGELQGFTQESRRVLLYALTTTDPNLQLPYVKRARAADDEVNRLLQEFAQIRLSSSAKERLSDLGHDWSRYVAVRNEIIGLVLEDRTADALRLEQAQAAPLFDVCARRLREIKSMLDQFAKQQLVQVRKTYYRCGAEVGFLILTLLLFIVSMRMLTALRRKNQRLSDAEILERQRSRILESINRNTPLPEICSAVCSLVEKRVPGSCVSIKWAQGDLSFSEESCKPCPVEESPPLSLPIVGHLGEELATLIVSGEIETSLQEDALVFCERAVQLTALAIEHHRVTGRLAFQAEHDGLTGLANRAKFQQSLAQALVRSEHSPNAFAILWIDLDRFKQVNDMFGHHVGDFLLQQTAARISSCVSPVDTVARVGGDEFVVLLSQACSIGTATRSAKTILDALNLPVAAEEHELSVGASIGISLFPDHGRDSESLLRNADTAMYSAKTQNKNMIQVYDNNMGAQLSEDLEIDRQLRTALDQEQFEIYFQPQCTVNGSITGAEALLRWNNPALGFVSPARFIPIAEESGVIVPLGAWVLRQACLEAMRLHRQGHSNFRIAVNVSAHQFVRSDFTATVESALRESGLHPRYLELELTESVVMDQIEKTVRQMNALRGLGIRIAIDDFGTGASSLSYLTQLPIDALKIDRSFVNLMDSQTSNTLPLIRAIVGMSKGLRLHLVAEGIETALQLKILELEGCSLFQGYFFHKPMDAARLTELLCLKNNALRSEETSSQLLASCA